MKKTLALAICALLSSQAGAMHYVRKKLSGVNSLVSARILLRYNGAGRNFATYKPLSGKLSDPKLKPTSAPEQKPKSELTQNAEAAGTPLRLGSIYNPHKQTWGRDRMLDWRRYSCMHPTKGMIVVHIFTYESVSCKLEISSTDIQGWKYKTPKSFVVGGNQNEKHVPCCLFEMNNAELNSLDPSLAQDAREQIKKNLSDEDLARRSDFDRYIIKAVK